MGQDRLKIGASCTAGIRKVEKVKIKDVKRICSVKKLLERYMSESHLKWQVHVQCMACDRLVKM